MAEHLGRALDAVPASPGAYCLQIALPAPLRHGIARLRPPLLPGGDYLYCGSACGPGGLRARLARHLRADKPAHWHVDRLTAAGRVIALGWARDVGECDLLAAWRALLGVTVPLPGFGSSDCRRCPAHLLECGAAADVRPTVPELSWVVLVPKGHKEITGPP